jgi:hypothetical protein
LSKELMLEKEQEGGGKKTGRKESKEGVKERMRE